MELKQKFKKIDCEDSRQYDPSKLIDQSRAVEIMDNFSREAPSFFGENLLFGFVFGGFAKGYATTDHDLDCFICLKSYDESQVANFHEWYFSLHAEYDLAPDIEMPGSIMDQRHLSEKLNFATTNPLKPTIESNYEKQAIVWADIMLGEKACKIGNFAELNSFEHTVRGLNQRWRKELITILGDEVDLETTKLPITRLFRKSVKYLKKGDRLLPP
jgi:hypothetical protein